MTNHERLAEQYEDALFALLMEGVAEVNGQAALELNQALQRDPGAEVPAAVRDRCEKTVRAAFVKRQLRATGRWSARWLTRVAVAAAVSGLMFTGAFAVSEQVRVATLNTLIQVMDDRTEIVFMGEQEEMGEVDGSEHVNISLTWLPEGFQLESSERNSMRSRVSYVDSVGALIEVTVTPCEPGLTYNFDSEDSAREVVMIQGCSATLYTASNDKIRSRYTNQNMPEIWSDRTLLWIDEENSVIINIFANNLTEGEMFKLAEGFCMEP